MKRSIRVSIAFLWLTVGYFIFGFVLRFALLLTPFAHEGSGMSLSSDSGVYYLAFSGQQGDALLAFVAQSGVYSVPIPASQTSRSSVMTRTRAANVYFEIAALALFALVSLPVLSRLLRPSA